jgi:hypothetical protein
MGNLIRLLFCLSDEKEKEEEEDAAVLARSHTDWTICFSLFFPSSFFLHECVRSQFFFFFFCRKKKEIFFSLLTIINLMCV